MDESNTESERWRLSRYAPPKPATGEWTADYVASFIRESYESPGHESLQAIADAHNASLDAVLPDERWVTQQLQVANKLCEELQQQLAAEREVGGNTAIALAQQITKLEDQVQTLADALTTAQATIKQYDDYIEELDRIAESK